MSGIERAMCMGLGSGRKRAQDYYYSKASGSGDQQEPGAGGEARLYNVVGVVCV